MKTVIIGGSYSGVQAALTLKKVQPDEPVVIIEKNDFISFAAGIINLELNEAAPDFYNHPSFDEKQLLELGVELKKEHLVLSVDIPGNRLLAEDLTTGKIAYESYDYLILAMGTVKKGGQLSNCLAAKGTYTYTGYQDSEKALQAIEQAKTITIVGGGYIGIELANGMRGMGKEISIVESSDAILHRYFDKIMIQFLEDRIVESGIKLLLNDTVLELTTSADGEKLVRTTAEEFATDLVLFAIHGRPDTRLIKGQITVLPDHTVKVNEKMQTTVENVYAVGDLVAYPVTNEDGSLYRPQVNQTLRTAVVAAMAIAGKPICYHPQQRTTMTNIFDTYSASAGVTLRQAQYEGIEVKSTLFKKEWQEKNHTGFIHLLLLFNELEDVLVGAQVLSSEEIVSTADYLSLAVNRGVTAEELATMDYAAYSNLSEPYHCLSEAAIQHLNEENKWHIIHSD